MANSIVDIGGLAKPVTVLIERISDAVGGIAKPWQIKRVAEAQAHAETIKAVARFQLPELQTRAMQRLLHEESSKQLNIESVVAKALPLVNEQAQPDNLGEDWLFNFFDKVKLIGEEHMQSVWARILAGEANVPGTFSRFTINVLGNMQQDDATSFSKLCGTAWAISDVPTYNVVIVFDPGEKFYQERGLSTLDLSHLERLGLVNVASPGNYTMSDLPAEVPLSYHGNHFKLILPAKGGIDVGMVTLSNVGRELFRICTVEPDFDLMNHTIERWKQKKYHIVDC